MDSKRILIVVTSAERMGSSMQTGVWLEEAVAPYYTFVDARHEVTIASPRGGAAPIDATSLQPENLTASTRRFEVDAKAKAALATTVKLSTLDPARFDAIYFPGGHGTMEDLPKDASVKTFVEHFYAHEKPLAAVCHGPAAFVGARKPDGSPLIEGHRFTCFSDQEETQVGLADTVPFLLESVLKEQGGIPHQAKPFVSNVVVEGPFVTGQNPASSIPAAEAVIHYLRSRSAFSAAA